LDPTCPPGERLRQDAHGPEVRLTAWIEDEVGGAVVAGESPTMLRTPYESEEGLIAR
jgi:hypothetical protein